MSKKDNWEIVLWLKRSRVGCNSESGNLGSSWVESCPQGEEKSLKIKVVRTDFVSNEEFATNTLILATFGQYVSQPSIEKFYLQQTIISTEKVKRIKDEQDVSCKRDLCIAHTKPQASGIIEGRVSEPEPKG